MVDVGRRDSLSAEREGSLLMKIWNDGEAVIVRQLLSVHGIPCQVVSDVPHTVLPFTVDGLGEVRILVPFACLALAIRVVADHRRMGLRVVRGGKRRPAPRAPERAADQGC